MHPFQRGPSHSQIGIGNSEPYNEMRVMTSWRLCFKVFLRGYLSCVSFKVLSFWAITWHMLIPANGSCYINLLVGGAPNTSVHSLHGRSHRPFKLRKKTRDAKMSWDAMLNFNHNAYVSGPASMRACSDV